MSYRDLILTRSRAYRACFLDDHDQLTREAEIVLADMARFCRAHSPCACVSPATGQIDPYATHVAVGRQEVFQRLQKYLRLDEHVLLNLKEESSE